MTPAPRTSSDACLPQGLSPPFCPPINRILIFVSSSQMFTSAITTAAWSSTSRSLDSAWWPTLVSSLAAGWRWRLRMAAPFLPYSLLYAVQNITSSSDEPPRWDSLLKTSTPRTSFGKAGECALLGRHNRNSGVERSRPSAMRTGTHLN